MQPDIPEAPLIQWRKAKSDKLYMLLMLDLDGNALGSYPDEVPPGSNSPLRHWIVANIPGKLLKSSGYQEKSGQAPEGSRIKVLMPYRSPHIRLVSDRYGLYLFEQKKFLDKKELADEGRLNFDYKAFPKQCDLDQSEVKAANYFVAVFVSDSPFSGKPFQGNDIVDWQSKKGQLLPSQ